MGFDSQSQSRQQGELIEPDQPDQTAIDQYASATHTSRRGAIRLAALIGGTSLFGAGSIATASAADSENDRPVIPPSRQYTDERIRYAIENTPHGGGEEYSETDGKLHPADADTSVETLEELEEALESSAEIVAIEDDIYVGDAELDLGNKTVVGDRGWDGSDGPLLHTDVGGYTNGGFRSGRPYTMFYSRAMDGPTPRVTGLRLRGHMDQYDEWDYYNYYRHLSRHVTFRGDRGEVDNCEMWGTSWNDVHALGYHPTDRVAEIEVHHCISRDSWQLGYGYGVDIWSGFAHVHHNYFNNHRHCVDGFGWPNSGYICEENIFGPWQVSHSVDMHCLTENGNGVGDDPEHPEYDLRAGGEMDIRNNTFCHIWQDASAISIRGVPWSHVHIHNNRFLDEEKPPYNSGNSRIYTWQQQNVHGVGHWGRVVPDGEYTEEWDHWDNQFDAANEEWEPEYGASIDIFRESPATPEPEPHDPPVEGTPAAVGLDESSPDPEGPPE